MTDTAFTRTELTRNDLPADIAYERFCAIMGSFATGVSVVTAQDADGRPCGLTCSAVCSVSADPPLLLSCVRTPSSTLDAIRATGRFAVNFLSTDAQAVSARFASRHPDKFAEIRWRPGDLGVPVLEDTVAHAECSLHDLVPAGDHVIVLGRVVGGRAAPERFPLGYWRGSYTGLFRVTPPRPERA
jgi:flavin reductase (DIM6/NTAB) family NADH-FMN oxidoreductase RutF